MFNVSDTFKAKPKASWWYLNCMSALHPQQQHGSFPISHFSKSLSRGSFRRDLFSLNSKAIRLTSETS